MDRGWSWQWILWRKVDARWQKQEGPGEESSPPIFFNTLDFMNTIHANRWSWQWLAGHKLQQSSSKLHRLRFSCGPQKESGCSGTWDTDCNYISVCLQSPTSCLASLSLSSKIEHSGAQGSSPQAVCASEPWVGWCTHGKNWQEHKAHVLFAKFVNDSLAPIYSGQRRRSKEQWWSLIVRNEGAAFA